MERKNRYKEKEIIYRKKNLETTFSKYIDSDIFWLGSLQRDSKT